MNEERDNAMWVHVCSVQYCEAVERGDESGQAMWLSQLAKEGVTSVDCEAIWAKMAEPTPAQRIALLLAPEKGWNVVIPERGRRYWMSQQSRWVYEYILDEEGEPAPLPDWEGDLNDAWQLFLDMSDDYTPRLVRILQPVDGVMELWTKAGILHNVTHDEISALKRDACAAICEAWLAWKDGAHG